MLGTRGVRLGLIHPEIYEMQARAIFRAARAVRERTGHAPRVEVMIPLVAYAARARDGARARAAGGRRGGRQARSRLQPGHDDRAAPRLPGRRRDRPPRRVLLLRHQRPHPDRPSASRATTSRRRSCRTTSTTGIVERSPFATIDERGVGELVQIAIERGRAARPGLRGRRLRRARRRPRVDRASSTAPAWTTSAARPSACRSRGWRLRRPPPRGAEPGLSARARSPAGRRTGPGGAGRGTGRARASGRPRPCARRRGGRPAGG